MFENTKKFCDSFLTLGVPGFDLVVYHDGKCILRYTKGFRDLENQTPMNGRERYNVYSCTKLLTCTAAMQLWEKGLFSLEDDLSAYMPEFGEMTVLTENGTRKAEKSIKIKHLFEMTAGFSYNCSSPSLKRAKQETGGRCPTRETMKYLAAEPLLFEPGERWNYSLCHDVLAALVEVLSGVKFEDYVKQNIFDPLGMKDSTLMLPEDELESLAPQYRFESGRAVNVGKHIVNYKLGSEYASGGAGGISTADDYIRFLEALRTGGVILKKETVDLMAANRLSPEQRRSYSYTNHGYGLGMRTPLEGSIFTDFGWGGAAGAFMAVDRENRLSVYHAQHLLSSPNQGLRIWIYCFLMADLFGRADYAEMIRKEKFPHEYGFTF